MRPFKPVRIKGAELGRTGKYIDMNGTEVDLTRAKFDEMVANFGAAGTDTPRIHLSHPNMFLHPTAPSIAPFERIYRDGNKLLGDIAPISIFEARMISHLGGYPNRSMEMRRDKEKGWMLTAVGALGAHAPGIPGMAPIMADMCEFMPDDDVKFGAADENLIFGLRLAAPEETMADNDNRSTAETISLAQFEEFKAGVDKQFETMKASLAAKDQEIERAQQAAALASSQAAAVTMQAQSDNAVAFAKGAVAALKITPAQGSLLPGILLAAEASGKTVEIEQEDGSRKTVSLADATRQFIESAVPFASDRMPGRAHFSAFHAPEQTQKDPEAAMLAQVTKLAAEKGVDLETALSLLSQGVE